MYFIIDLCKIVTFSSPAQDTCLEYNFLVWTKGISYQPIHFSIFLLTWESPTSLISPRLLSMYFPIQWNIFPISSVQVIPSFSWVNFTSPERSSVSQQVNASNFDVTFKAKKYVDSCFIYTLFFEEVMLWKVFEVAIKEILKSFFSIPQIIFTGCFTQCKPVVLHCSDEHSIEVKV